MDSSPCQLVGIRYLNSRPLLAGLDAQIPSQFPYLFRTGDPAFCADQLARGEAAAGLIPVAVLPSLSGVRLAADLGVACGREAVSVLLVSRVPLKKISHLAAHAASRTSIVLARLLLGELWGATPRVTELRSPLESLKDECDAALVIGDPALELRGSTGWVEVDLGSAWVKWTGLPFVFAVWAAMPAAPAGIGDLVEDSYRYARDNWALLMQQWAGNHGVSLESARRYLEVSLHHRLGGQEFRALDMFFQRAARAGLLPDGFSMARE